jgi:Dullard-like phosphatase family protein
MQNKNSLNNPKDLKRSQSKNKERLFSNFMKYSRSKESLLNLSQLKKEQKREKSQNLSKSPVIQKSKKRIQNLIKNYEKSIKRELNLSKSLKKKTGLEDNKVLSNLKKSSLKKSDSTIEKNSFKNLKLYPYNIFGNIKKKYSKNGESLFKNSKSFFELSLFELYNKKKKEQNLKSKNPLKNFFEGIKNNSDIKYPLKNQFSGFMKKVTKKNSDNSIEKVNLNNNKRKSCRLINNRIKLDKTKIFPTKKELVSSRKSTTKNLHSFVIEKINKIDFDKIFQSEQFVFEFTQAVYNNNDIYDIFKDYIEFVQDFDFSRFLKLFHDFEKNLNFKVALIFERTVMMVIFYINIHEKNNEDRIFLHKILVRVYSNIYIFITSLINDFFDDSLIEKYKEKIDLISSRNFKNLKITINKEVNINNKKIANYLNFILANLNNEISSQILKLQEFIEDLSLEEGLSFLVKTFNKVYEEKGVTKNEKTEKKINKEKSFLKKEKTSDHEKETKNIKESFKNNGNKKILKNDEKEYTLVLDLDETLIHYNQENDEGKVFFRPFLEKFLDELKNHYYIIIFTASLKEYADIILDHLDPNNDIFKERYYREHLQEKETCFVKDLTILKRDIKKIIIVDNLPENFREQKENGIYIHSWYSDENDNALMNLLPILFEIIEKKVPDVRVFLKNYKNKMIENIQRGSLNPSFVLKEIEHK